MPILLLALAAAAQTAEQPGTTHEVLDRGGKIVAGPAHDVGVAKTVIPPVLEKARASPYGLAGVRTCAQLQGAIGDLTRIIGPDFASGDNRKENEVERLAEAGGKTLVNAIVPFRGLVREISGAAPAERRFDEAVDAGFARRGFLRGLAVARKCPGATR